MNRRDFLRHYIGLGSIAVPALSFAENISRNKEKLKKSKKSAILIWLGGGPPTIDMWDLKTGTKEGGPFQSIPTKGEFRICEYLPALAKLGKDFSIIRSMSTREADHMRGSYIMHTGFAPSSTVIHPSLGSTVAYELSKFNRGLDIPPFFSINTGSFNSGYLSSSFNPFSVNSAGRISNLGVIKNFDRKMQFLNEIEDGFISSNRGDDGEHKNLIRDTAKLMTSPQMDALKVDQDESLPIYRNTAFGRSALMARRLIEQGVSFVEIGFGGWDLHSMTHQTLSNKLPELDHVLSTLFFDLKRLDLWDTTAIIVMGEFGRTPKINQDAGRDHWAASWSAIVAGGLFKTGFTVGETSKDGMEIIGKSYNSADLLTTVSKALEIDTDITYTSKNGRPMKILGGGTIIEQLI